MRLMETILRVVSITSFIVSVFVDNEQLRFQLLNSGLTTMILAHLYQLENKRSIKTETLNIIKAHSELEKVLMYIKEQQYKNLMCINNVATRKNLKKYRLEAGGAASAIISDLERLYNDKEEVK